MPRIPESEIERLKKEISLLRLIQSQGHVLAKRGKDWAMRCIFHEDATASLVVTESKNLYHCFGCNAAGSVLDWVMKTQSVSLPHAVQILKTGAPLEGERIGVARSQMRHLAPLVAAETASPSTASNDQGAQGDHSPQALQVLLAQVVDSYHANLKTSPEALAYLQERGLDHPELVDHFQLGYANKSLTYRLPPGHTQGGRAVRAQLQGLGVLRDTGHEHLNGCMVVPVVGLAGGAAPAHAGQVLQLYGRRIVANNKIPANQARHLYSCRSKLKVSGSRRISLMSARASSTSSWKGSFMWANLLLKLNRRQVNIGGSWVNVRQSKDVHSGTGGRNVQAGLCGWRGLYLPPGAAIPTAPLAAAHGCADAGIGPVNGVGVQGDAWGRFC